MKKFLLGVGLLSCITLLADTTATPEYWTVSAHPSVAQPANPVYAEASTIEELYCLDGPDEVICAINQTEDTFLYREDA